MDGGERCGGEGVQPHGEVVGYFAVALHLLLGEADVGVDGWSLLMRLLGELVQDGHHLLGVSALDALEGLLIGRVAHLAGPPHPVF